jgi:Lon protease-like protein
MGCDEYGDDLQQKLDDVPIFPLPGCVLFPHTLLPLHIFEPRYRQMTEHVLAGNQLLAMANCDRDEHVFETAGVGRIVHHERLPDGRFHILLQGIARIRIVDEHPAGANLYRRVVAQIIDDLPDDAAAVDASLHALRSCYAQLRQVSPEPPFGDLPHRIHDPIVLADVICAAALASPDDRQRALEERSVVERLRLATDAVADLLLAAVPPSETLH